MKNLFSTFLIVLSFPFVAQTATPPDVPEGARRQGFGQPYRTMSVQMDADEQPERVMLFSRDNGHYPNFDLFLTYLAVVDSKTGEVQYVSDTGRTIYRDLWFEDRGGHKALVWESFENGYFTVDREGNDLQTVWVRRVLDLGSAPAINGVSATADGGASLVATADGGATGSAVPAVESVSAAPAVEIIPPSKVVLGYVTSWNPAMPDPKLLTHINYAFGHVTDTFDGIRINVPERLHEVVKLREQNPRLKILLSVGGWGSGRFSEMAADEGFRLSFARDACRVVDEFALDGIDIDWEYPTSDAAGISASADDTDNFTLLMRIFFYIIS